MSQPDDAEIDRGHVKPVRRGLLWLSRIVTSVAYVYVMAIEILLGIGFVLLLLGANPTSDFVSWVYRSLDRAMRPFRGIFEPIELGRTGNDVPSVFETSVLFAMIVYAVIAIVIHGVLAWMRGQLARLDREDELYRQEQLVRQLSRPATYPVGDASAYGTMPPSTMPPSTMPPSTMPPSTMPSPAGGSMAGPADGVPPPPSAV